MITLTPPRFRFFGKALRNKKLNILDVGAGTHSPTDTKRVFPNCIYHGIDITNYNNSDADFALMDRYFEMDVTLLQFDTIPNNFYDIVILSHIIEHLYNGDKVIEALCPKLKRGG